MFSGQHSARFRTFTPAWREGRAICRFVLYLGDEVTVSSLVTEPVNSIIHQSFHSHERDEPLNGDGFGIAWYVPEFHDEPAVFKDITPAWNNVNLLNLARVTRSSCILAHVRAATQGLPVIQLNCHPFVHGPFSFMHNGKVGGFQEMRRALMRGLSDDAFHAISGTTDSEYLFALFLDHHRRISDGLERSEALAEALAATVCEVEEQREKAGIEETSFLNLAVTDGTNAVVTRYISRDPEKANSLYVHSGATCACLDGHLRFLEPSEGRTAIMIASEPLTEEDQWVSVPPNNMLVVDEDLHIEMRHIPGIP